MPRSPLPPERLAFFVDRSLGYYLIPGKLREWGHEVHTIRSEFGARAEETLPDTAWLTRAGEQEWIVLTKDARMRYRPAELQAISDARLRVFCLASARLTGSEQAERIRRNLNRMVVRVRCPGPWIDSVHDHTVVRMWPRPAARAQTVGR